MQSGATPTGTVISTPAKFKVEDPGSVVYGSLLGGKKVILEDGGPVEAVAA